MRFRFARPYRTRHTPGSMNGTERKYAEHLAVLRAGGQIVDYRFEAIKLRLADKTFYTPDFVVVTPEWIELHEVKGGFVRDDASVKFKVAREEFPWFRFVMRQLTRAGWSEVLQECGT